MSRTCRYWIGSSLVTSTSPAFAWNVERNVVGEGVERAAVRCEDAIGVVALLDAEPEVDLVASGVAERHRCEAGAQRSDRGKTRFDRSGGRRVVALVERALRALGLAGDGGN